MRIAKKALSLMLTFCMVLSLAVNITAAEPAAKSGTSDELLKIVHLDAGRKYFDVDSIKEIIDTMSESGYNALELAVGNDGMRFLLDNMRLIVGDQIYSSKDVKAAIQQGNREYANFETNELTESEMDEVIQYAANKGISIIPLINTPGHMDAILSAMTQLGVSNAAYYNSERTIDVTNEDAKDFTLAFVKKYIEYFSAKGCRIFNMGADEYANDVYTSGGMGFGQLRSQEQYDDFLQYVNAMAAQIKEAGMKPMAFNDGIYYGSDTSAGTIDTDILIAYWTSGWSGYDVASASFLAEQGFELVNTNGDYYWIIGGSQCSAEKAEGFKVNSFMGENSALDAAGAMFCIWSDVPKAMTSQEAVQKVKSVITAFGNALSTDEETNPDVPNSSQTIEIAAGESATITIPNEDLTGNVDTSLLDEDIAKVSVQTKATETEDNWQLVTNGAAGIIPGDEYLIVSGSNGEQYAMTSDGSAFRVSISDEVIENASDDIVFKLITNGNGYSLQDSNGRYLYPNASRTLFWWSYNLTADNQNAEMVTIEGSSSVTISREFSSSDSTTTSYVEYSAPGWVTEADFGAGSNASDLYLFHHVQTEEGVSTEITFTGVSAGTTYVTVGDITYEIVVKDQAPADALKTFNLEVEYWITNSMVYENDTDQSAHSTEISRNEASGEDGVAIMDQVPEIAHSNYDGWVELNFWQAMRLDSQNHQSGDSGDDETADGTTFTRVRWHNEAWQYMTTDGVWHYFMSGDQAVAYYMRHTEITTEITTAMKDWGYDPTQSGGTPDTSGGDGQVALTVAVVYPDNTVSPVEENMYSQSTTIFNYWEGRDIGIIAPLNNSAYEVSKITVTDGERDENTKRNIWYPTDSIVWEKVETESGSSWYDETEVWNSSMGTEPMVNGKASNITWSAKNTAKLVLIYLQPVHHDSNLTVNWVDDSADALINTMEVVVSYEGTDELTFLNGLVQNSHVPQTGGVFTLDDDAYIINSSGVKQTFNKDITVMDVDPQYRSGLYQYVQAEVSADGKTLTLHYSLNTELLSSEYVIDFGLPVEVPVSDLVENSDQVQDVTSTSSEITYDNSRKMITYTPADVLLDIDPVVVRILYSGGTTQKFNIGFVPATSVYYEEGFATYSEEWTEGSKGKGIQQTAKPGAEDAHSYGYDSKYASEPSGESNGTQVISETYGDTAELKFSGTGIDIYTNSTPDSGRLFITVTNSQGSIVKLVQVETALKNGNTDATVGQETEGYNIPVASLDLGERDTYTVKLSHMKTTAEDTGDVVSIDGYRIYGTLDESREAYVSDRENDPTYVELRDQVLSALNVDVEHSQYADEIAKDTISQVYSKTGTTEGAVLLSAEGNVGNAQDILDNGPKNELYLHPDQSVVFKVSKANKGNVQIGLKALNQSVNYTINGETKNLSSSTDMFYQLDVQEGEEETFIITNNRTDGGILAITKIKFPETKTGENDTEISMFSALNAEDLIPALNDLGIENRPVEADAEAQINLTDYTGKVVASTTLSSTGEEGNEALFSAEVIQSAAEKVLPEHYAFVDENDFEDLNVKFGEKAEVNVQVGKVATLNVTYKTLFGQTKGKLTLTAVQTSSASSYKFSASDLRKAAPDNLYWTGTLIGSTVKYGETKDRTVIGLGI